MAPNEVFTGVKLPLYDPYCGLMFLVVQCFVLDPRIQDGKKLPKLTLWPWRFFRTGTTLPSKRGCSRWWISHHPENTASICMKYHWSNPSVSTNTLETSQCHNTYLLYVFSSMLTISLAISPSNTMCTTPSMSVCRNAPGMSVTMMYLLSLASV